MKFLLVLAAAYTFIPQFKEQINMLLLKLLGDSGVNPGDSDGGIPPVVVDPIDDSLPDGYPRRHSNGLLLEPDMTIGALGNYGVDGSLLGDYLLQQDAGGFARAVFSLWAKRGTRGLFATQDGEMPVVEQGAEPYMVYHVGNSHPYDTVTGYVEVYSVNSLGYPVNKDVVSLAAAYALYNHFGITCYVRNYNDHNGTSWRDGWTAFRHWPLWPEGDLIGNWANITSVFGTSAYTPYFRRKYE